MEPDLEALGGAPPPAPAAAAPSSGAGGDPAVWTLLGEAGPDPQGQLAVASTIYNRSNHLGQTPQQIVADPANGYEAWQDAGARTRIEQQYPVGSPAYRAAQAVLAGVQSGETAPLSYTHFYSPQAQAAAGRAVPAWAASAQGTDVGGNRFYSLPGQLPHAEPDLVALGYGTGARVQIEPGAGYGGAGQPTNAVPDPTATTYRFLGANGMIDPSAPGGSSTNPTALPMNATDDQMPKGVWYVNHAGQLRTGGDPTDYLPRYEQLVAQRKAAASAPLGDRLATAAGQGLLDVGASVNRMMGGYGGIATPNAYVGDNDFLAQPSADAGRAQAALTGAAVERNQYDLLHAGDVPMAIGRFAGQAVPVTLAGLATGGALEGAGPFGEFLAGEGGGANLFGQGASRLTGGALQGAQASALTSSTSDRPLGEQMATGAALGGPLALAGPMVSGAAQRLVTGAPLPAGPTTDLAATMMGKWGIPLRAGQIRGALGDRAAATADSNLVGSSSEFAANNDEQKAALMRGMTSTYGDPSGDVSPPALSAARAQLGQVFDRVAANTPAIPADPLMTRLGQIVHQASRTLPDSDLKPLLNQVEDIGSTVQNHAISGATYQALTRTGEPLDLLMSSDKPNVEHFAGQIRDALDDALASVAQPQDVADLARARFQYKNLMTVAKLAPRATVNGAVSPALLAGAVRNNFQNMAFQGAGDLGELALGAQTFMKEPPNSYSADRAADRLGGWVGPGLSAGLEAGSLFFKNPELGYAAAGALGATAAARGFGAAAQALKKTRLGPNAADRLINPGQGLPAITPYVLPGAVVGGNQFLPAPVANP